MSFCSQFLRNILYFSLLFSTTISANLIDTCELQSPSGRYVTFYAVNFQEGSPKLAFNVLMPIFESKALAGPVEFLFQGSSSYVTSKIHAAYYEKDKFLYEHQCIQKKLERLFNLRLEPMKTKIRGTAPQKSFSFSSHFNINNEVDCNFENLALLFHESQKIDIHGEIDDLGQFFSLTKDYLQACFLKEHFTGNLDFVDYCLQDDFFSFAHSPVVDLIGIMKNQIQYQINILDDLIRLTQPKKEIAQWGKLMKLLLSDRKDFTNSIKTLELLQGALFSEICGIKKICAIRGDRGGVDTFDEGISSNNAFRLLFQALRSRDKWGEHPDQFTRGNMHQILQVLMEFVNECCALGQGYGALILSIIARVSAIDQLPDDQPSDVKTMAGKKKNVVVVSSYATALASAEFLTEVFGYTELKKFSRG